MHRIDTPAWMEERALIRFETINLPTTALVVVDMQVVFVEDGQRFAKQHARDIVPNINALADAVRSGGGLVVHTRHTLTDTGPGSMPDWQMADPALRALWEVFRPGTREHGLDPRMDVRPGDIVLDKYRYSALTWNSSTLREELQARGIDTLIIVGAAAIAAARRRRAMRPSWATRPSSFPMRPRL